MIVQAEELLGLSTVIVAPTSRSAARATFRPEVEVAGEDELVSSWNRSARIDIERLDKLAGRLTSSEQRSVDEALALVLDLNWTRPF